MSKFRKTKIREQRDGGTREFGGENGHVQETREFLESGDVDRYQNHTSRFASGSKRTGSHCGLRCTYSLNFSYFLVLVFVSLEFLSGEQNIQCRLDITEMYQPDEERLRTFWTTLQEVWIELYGSRLATAARSTGTLRRVDVSSRCVVIIV